MSQSGLSYAQAPPFAAPLYFFLVAPVFLLLAAGLGLFHADWLTDGLTNRWSPTTLALTHLITLGFLAMIMLGSLLQLLPVVLGAPVPAVRLVAWLGLLGLSIGTPCLALGFLLGEPLWLYAAMLVLSAGLAPFIFAISTSLIRTHAMPHVVWPIRLAGAALIGVLGLGLALAGRFVGLWSISSVVELTALHTAWGLVGWVLMLVIGLAYQVVPMLQITPSYPPFMTRWLIWLMLAGLLLFSGLLETGLLQPGWGETSSQLGMLLICIASLTFALTTLRIQAQRRRKVADVTLDFWRLGMTCLILAALLFPGLRWLSANETAAAEISLAMLFLLGFAVSVVSGMLYKIVPFLAWFHLNRSLTTTIKIH